MESKHHILIHFPLLNLLTCLSYCSVLQTADIVGGTCDSRLYQMVDMLKKTYAESDTCRLIFVRKLKVRVLRSNFMSDERTSQQDIDQVIRIAIVATEVNISTC